MHQVLLEYIMATSIKPDPSSHEAKRSIDWATTALLYLLFMFTLLVRLRQHVQMFGDEWCTQNEKVPFFLLSRNPTDSVFIISLYI